MFIVWFCLVFLRKNVAPFFSNLHLSFVFCGRISVQFFVFIIFSNAHVCFVFRHAQFFVFANFVANVIQVLVMYLNLRVYLIVFVFIGRMFIL